MYSKESLLENSTKKITQNPPHTAQKWEQIGELWEKAIHQLERIEVSEPSYVEAQKLIAQYQTNLGNIKSRGQMERDAMEILKEANHKIEFIPLYLCSSAFICG